MIITTSMCVVAWAFSLSPEWGVVAMLFVLPSVVGWFQNHVEDFDSKTPGAQFTAIMPPADLDAEPRPGENPQPED
ncbi:MAG: hypothetical protein U0836_03625 [Pirellulales bacterium]